MTGEQVVDYVRQGRLQEVLEGKGVYFCENHTWRDSHDVIWILRTLSHWIERDGGAESFSKVLEDTLSRMALLHPEVVLSVLLAYSIIMSSEVIGFVIDIDKIIRLTRESVPDWRSAKMSHGASFEEVIGSINKFR